MPLENVSLSGSKPSPAATEHPYLDKDQGKIRRLFDAIAPRYDLLNHLLSFNIDRWWRRVAVRELHLERDGCYLDACTGTGDLSYSLLRELRPLGGHHRVFSSDFSLPMLQLGQKKRRPGTSPRFLAGDTLELPFAADTFDGAMVGFGIRNVADLHEGLVELRRVLRRGRRLVLLEFTSLDVPLVGPVFEFYSERVLPRIGNLLSRSPDDAYTYLHQSIQRWPKGDELVEILRGAGFKGARWRRLFPGNVAIHVGHA